VSLGPVPSRPNPRSRVRPLRPALRVARTPRVRVIDPARFHLRRRVRSVNWRRLLVLGVAVYTAAMAGRAITQWRHLASREHQLQAQVQQVDAHNRQLATTLARLKSAAYTEQSARQELGYAFPGELSFTTVSGH
jgi:cell division protein FtsB